MNLSSGPMCPQKFFMCFFFEQNHHSKIAIMQHTCSRFTFKRGVKTADLNHFSCQHGSADRFLRFLSDWKKLLCTWKKKFFEQKCVNVKKWERGKNLCVLNSLMTHFCKMGQLNMKHLKLLDSVLEKRELSG